MEEELMFNINALNLNAPKAIVYGADMSERCIITLSQSIHLWHIDLVLAAYRIYWTGMGKRDPELNKEDGIKFIPIPGTNNSKQDMVRISQRIIDAVCRNGRYDQPNLLRKLNDGRYTLLKRFYDRDMEVYVSGGYTNPYFFIRRIGNNDVVKSFDSYTDAIDYVA